MKSFYLFVEPHEREGYLKLDFRCEKFLKTEKLYCRNLLNERAKIYSIFDCVDSMLDSIEKKSNEGIVPTNEEGKTLYENTSAV